MYIEKLQNWGNKEWNKFYKQFSLTHNEKKEVKQILTMPTKSGVELSFERLKELDIINGIGPGFFSNFTRKFITWLFPYFRYEWHDIGYSLGGNNKDKYEYDKGMLKYTTYSIQQITGNRIDNGNVFIIGYNLFVCVPIKYFIAFMFYILVRVFGVLSFNYNK